jgi:glycyl-tRNA synthetase
MEISQYTYFQQAGGFALDPVAVELTYGLERIAMYLQKVSKVWDISWDGKQTYGDILLRQEIEYCEYEFNVADVETLKASYNFYEAESKRCLEQGLVVPAHDYVLKCSHAFNILDTRGAIGVTERAAYFGRMRRMSHQVARAFVEQREKLGYPLLKYMPPRPKNEIPAVTQIKQPAALLFEIGSEELPSHDVVDAIAHLEMAVPKFLADLRLTHGEVKVMGTPRRLAILVADLAPRQADLEETARGPAAKIAFDANGQPTKAALGFAKGKGIDTAALEVQSVNGVEYIVARVKTTGRPTAEVLAETLPNLIKGIPFGRSMRWLASAQVGEEVAKIAYSRPLRWLVALFDDVIVPFEYAGVVSGRVTRGLRPEGSPEIGISHAAAYLDTMHEHRVTVDHVTRRHEIQNQLAALAAELGGYVPDDEALLTEVTHLVEQPTALVGSFEERYLALPVPVLITVMKKHQRYFPIISRLNNGLMPNFLTVRNGGAEYLGLVRHGNEGVLRARYADADFFFKADSQKTIAEFLPRLDTLIFQEKLGSMLDKSKRLEMLAPQIGERLQLTSAELQTTARAAQLSKADLATHMVVELTSLQGIMGYEYAKRSGESEQVAAAIVEHYYPQVKLPHKAISRAGLALNLANRLDSLIGLFAVGKAPTGSADPFGLRRDALSLVTILLETQTSFNVVEGLKLAAALMPMSVSAESLTETSDFVTRRLEGVLKDEHGLPHDVVQAVLAERGHNPALALAAARDLVAVRGDVSVTLPFIDSTAVLYQPSATTANSSDWTNLLTAYARCVRLVRPITERFMVQPAYFTEPSEEALYIAYQKAKASLSPASSLEAVLAAIRELLVVPINTFFDKVMVMVDDEQVRQNRLALLQDIRDLTKGYADFSQLQGF